MEVPAVIAAAPDAVPAESEPTSRGVILVVDDEESFRTVVVRQLRNAGFATIEAHDGSDAIRKFAEHRESIAAVLLDLVMPNTSGGETLAMLRCYSPALPVVLTSGYSVHDAVSLTGTERGVRFLQKPFTAAQLTSELRHAIDEPPPAHRHSTPPRPLFQ
jgi:CheY-like chemotaxis protein